MPKVFLSAEDRALAREARELDRLSELVRTCKGRTRQKDGDTAQQAGLSRMTFAEIKHPGRAGALSLRSARRLAHAVGCTKEDWLRIGGFE